MIIKNKNFILKKIIFLAMLIIIVAIVSVITYKFNPPNSLVLLSKNKNNKLVVVSIDSIDGTVFVKASDWPYTFMEPSIIGDASWSDRFIISNFYWSNDETLIVWEVQEKNENIKRYEAAYDFREHITIDIELLSWDKQKCNNAINDLLNERGGISPTVINIPSLNSGKYQ